MLLQKRKYSIKKENKFKGNEKNKQVENKISTLIQEKDNRKQTYDQNHPSEEKKIMETIKEKPINILIAEDKVNAHQKESSERKVLSLERILNNNSENRINLYPQDYFMMYKQNYSKPLYILVYKNFKEGIIT